MSDDSFTASQAARASGRPVEDVWPEAQLAALFQARFEEGIAPALAAEVSRPGRPRVQVLRGAVDDAGHPPGERTAFRIASCTKSFTAAAALVLRRAGRLDLEADVREWLPGLRFTGEFAADGPVTVRHLLTMSSGLPEDDPWADRQESMPAEQFDALLAGGIRLASAPGARFRYSNLGYALLGRILERAAGTDFRTLVTGSLLRPLGLTDTAFAAEELQVPAVRGFRRTPDGGWQVLPFTGPGQFSPIGGLFSTLQDLRRWAAWLAAGPAFASDPSTAGMSATGPLSGGPVDAGLDAGPLDLVDRAEMQRIHRPIPLRPQDLPGTRRGYGFGLNILEHPAAGRIVSHSGGYPGFSTHMRWHPETGTIALGLENATYSRVGEAVTRALDMTLGLVPEEPAAPADPAGHAPSAAPEDEDRAGVAGPAGPGTWPELQAARDALTVWLSSPTAEAERLLRAQFASNMDQDRPWDERRRDWLRLRTAAGPLHAEEAHTTGGDAPAELRWMLPGEHGDLRCLAQLNPVEPPQVQRLEITLDPRSTG